MWHGSSRAVAGRGKAVAGQWLGVAGCVKAVSLCGQICGVGKQGEGGGGVYITGEGWWQGAAGCGGVMLGSSGM